MIISRGGEWFASMGTAKSKGTKTFCLVGKVNNTGLIEVPMGTSLWTIIYNIGGGIPKGKRFKAIQTGGPSGGCIPESLLGLPVDYEELTKAGSIMGSGGLVVMDEETCMVDIARYFVDFLEEESCGKCMPCREGTRRMNEILTRITEGQGTIEDLETLETLASTIKDTSLCGLGQTSPNPVLSTLRYFRDEYLVHIQEKRCPAAFCKALIKYNINADLCTGCDACQVVCPEKAITGEKKKTHYLDQTKCIKCGSCIQVCKSNAVYKS
jgi:NADH:ubiquinone oxidoreductase subunit F (NADH-binding)/ferredoxin